jgi:hypothetical protein
VKCEIYEWKYGSWSRHLEELCSVKQAQNGSRVPILQNISMKYIYNDDDDDDDDGHEPQQQSLGHQPAQTSTMLDLSIIQDTSTA